MARLTDALFLRICNNNVTPITSTRYSIADHADPPAYDVGPGGYLYRGNKWYLPWSTVFA